MSESLLFPKLKVEISRKWTRVGTPEASRRAPKLESDEIRVLDRERDPTHDLVVAMCFVRQRNEAEVKPARPKEKGGQAYGPAVAHSPVLAITGWRLGRRLSPADEEYLGRRQFFSFVSLAERLLRKPMEASFSYVDRPQTGGGDATTSNITGTQIIAERGFA
ncbi:hypothetical protein TgHK011_001203 [Trichoderma gracile]|nr:hypothetical protein TgHK011_001203 [Trichoderma gracile]